MSNEQRVVELTAMQEWLKWFDENRLEVILNIDVAKDKATELLAKEKSQIVDAWDNGWKVGTDDVCRLNRGIGFSETTPEDYYSLTYKEINVREL